MRARDQSSDALILITVTTLISKHHSASSFYGGFGAPVLESPDFLIRSQHLEAAVESGVNVHHRAAVVELPAVVGG